METIQYRRKLTSQVIMLIRSLEMVTYYFINDKPENLLAKDWVHPLTSSYLMKSGYLFFLTFWISSGQTGF